MADVQIPVLRAARASKKVAMPRFRNKPMSLTEVVHRVLQRVLNNTEPFGVFAVNGKLVLSNTNTDRFKCLRRRSAASFIAIYGPGLKVADLIEDLRDFFSDEVTNGVA